MDEQRDLEGLSALVTGATSGIGKAAAEELGRRGAEVIVHGRDAARGAAVADTITGEGGKARFAAADLSDPAQLDDLVEQVGTVDILVNNAGISWPGPTADLDVATFDRLFAANVRAPYFLVAALAPKMAARGSGSIINIGSQAGQIGMPAARRLQRHQRGTGIDDPFLGGRVQPRRSPGQCRRRRACLHAHPAARSRRGRRSGHHHGAGRPA